MTFKHNIAPRWVIFLLDLSISGFAFLFAYLVRQSLTLRPLLWEDIVADLLLLTLVNALLFWRLHTYAGIIRYTGVQDVLHIGFSVLLSCSLFYTIGLLHLPLVKASKLGPIVLFVYGSFSILGLLSYRLIVKYSYYYSRKGGSEIKRVLIFGAGEAGVITQRVLSNDPSAHYSVVGFVDDNERKIGSLMNGIPVLSLEQARKRLKRLGAEELILSVFAISTQRKNEVVDFCLQQNLKVLTIPAYIQQTQGDFNSRELKSIDIEDLLEREPINLSTERISEQLKGKRILVTGAAGSIGSEIVRQVLKYQPAKLVLCDQAETPLFHLDLELGLKKLRERTVLFMGDVTNEHRMRELFQQHRPQIVYHAAAYKHVPMMEQNPAEAVRNNCFGSRLMADLSLEYGAERFVMVSTDKAVNPANVMGASKRLAEMYVQALSGSGPHRTSFITTRFGNVLGSNGSVVNLFREQIEKGGPVTVTHPDINRYFMTIPEACSLVLEAGCMGRGGEVFVFDMGQPVRIKDMAEKMIRLYGLRPHQDVKIEFTGLRPGEKLYEELLTEGENILHTHHSKIKIAQLQPVLLKEAKACLASLEQKVRKGALGEELVQVIKEFVPEFLSNNSEFEVLDGKVVLVKAV